jgi:hypothetical protein
MVNFTPTRRFFKLDKDEAMKKTLIAAVIAFCVACFSSVSFADTGMFAAPAIAAQSTESPAYCIRGGDADLADPLSLAAVDGGTMLAVCDSCHVGIKTSDRPASKKKKGGRGGYKSIPGLALAPIEVGWRNSQTV